MDSSLDGPGRESVGEVPVSRASASVFINCPFDEGYRPLFQAIVFTVLRCGFHPRCALEFEDSGEVRIDKIADLVRRCGYGVHDVSRTELNEQSLPRFNMPFELGLFLGAKRFGGKAQKAKRTLVMDVERHRYQKFLSDIGGQDVAAHGGKPGSAIRAIRDFLNAPDIKGAPAPSAQRIVADHRRCEKARRRWCESEGHDFEAPPYPDLVWFYSRFVAALAT